MTRRKTTDSQALVSIICRTVNRPTLAQTIASIAKQDWPSLELVLVDATGKGLLNLEETPPHISLNIVTQNKPLNRAQAANAGLDAAQGDYLLFLDDDDWISPKHISQLMRHVIKHPEKKVVYSKTRKTSVDGNLIDDVIAVPFDRTMLRRDNYIPIHSALFSASLPQAGCRFDKNLEVYEDWDFWLQCAEHTDFKLVYHTGAYYRLGGDSETMLAQHNQRYEAGHPIAEARAKLLHKWRRRWSGEQWNTLLGLIDKSHELQSVHNDLRLAQTDLKEFRDELKLAHHNIKLVQRELELAHGAINERDKIHQQLQNDYAKLHHAHLKLDQGVKEILTSFSWRVTAPYRWTARRLFRLVKSVLPVRGKSPARTDSVAEQGMEGGMLSPSSDNFVCGHVITIQAWAWSVDSLSHVDVLIDENFICKMESVPQFDNADDAKRSGFAVRVNLGNLQPGAHQIRLEVRDIKNRVSCMTRTIIYQDPDLNYIHWLKTRQSIYRGTTGLETFKFTPHLTEFRIVVLAGKSDNNASLLSTLQDIRKQDTSQWHCNVITQESETTRIKNLINSLNCATDQFSIFTDLPELEIHQNAAYCFLRPGERLVDTSLRVISESWKPDLHLLYSDHDSVNSSGTHSQPWFTFGWSPALLFSNNYIGGVYFVKGSSLSRSIIIDAGNPFKDSSWRYNVLLRLSASLSSGNVERIPEMLWSEPELSASARSKRNNEELAAVCDVLSSQYHISNADVKSQDGIRHIAWPIDALPRVSVIIPTTGNMRFLKPCLDTISNTDYQDLELIVLDNSRGAHPDGIEYARLAGATVIECDEPFNWSRLNNKGAKQSTGDIYLFLNDDIEITHPDWLSEMVRQVLQDDVGTVGCMLLYPNGAIQHAGVFLVDHGGGARHLFHKQLPGEGIYQQLDKTVREVSANTGACLMSRREIFEKLNGFDEDLSIVGNDIDFCLRALSAGLRNIWTPHSQLIHHESVSRTSKPITKDEKSMWKRWGHLFTTGDNYYNPSLSLTREDCSISDVALPANWNLDSLPQSTSAGLHGVNLIAYIRASMGVGEAARGNAAALNSSEIPFGIINYERGNPSRMDNLRWQQFEVNEPTYDINLFHINADHLPAVITDLGHDITRNRYNIGYWAWELPEFPDRWLDSFNHIDEIWVPSTFVNQAISAKSPVPVITVPHVVSIDPGSANRFSRADFGINPAAFVFVSMFDIHSVAQRKNPYGAISAFKKAFAAEDSRVQLVIKINNADKASAKLLRKHIGDFKNILIIDKHLDRSGIDSLINCIDCYVSLHHSEGFGLGPAEAMFLGKAAILTNWSGNLEYMRHNNCLAVDYTLVQLGKDYGPYEAHQHWAAPDIDQAAQYMSMIAADPDKARTIGERGRQTIMSEFSADAIGKRMKARLDSIARIRMKV